MSEHVVIASAGGGCNSKWMIAKWVTQKRPLHIVLFADTGDYIHGKNAEKPETYADMLDFGQWLMWHGVPCQWVRVTGETLYDNSFRRKALPAIAYGFKTCSSRWKIEPQERFLNRWIVTREAWTRMEKVTRLVGYHAGEPKRIRPYEDEKYVNRYPLAEDGDDQEACEAGLVSLGLPVPPKSSCHFCPNMKRDEIVRLGLAQQESALSLERNADLTTIRGLGRTWSWADVLTAQRELPVEIEREMPCGCFDGE